MAKVGMLYMDYPKFDIYDECDNRSYASSREAWRIRPAPTALVSESNRRIS